MPRSTLHVIFLTLLMSIAQSAGQSHRSLQHLDSGESHSNIICSLLLPVDSNLVITMSADGTLKATDLDLNEIRYAQKVSLTSCIVALAYDKQEDRFAYVDRDQVLLSRVKDGRKIDSISIPKQYGTVSALAFQPIGSLLAIGLSSGRVVLHTVGSRNGPLKTFTAAVSTLNFTSDGKKLLIGFDDGSIRMWNIGTGTEDAFPLNHTTGVISMGILPGTNFSVSGDLKGIIRIWNTADRVSEVSRWVGHVPSSQSLLPAPDGSGVFWLSSDSTIRFQPIGSDSIGSTPSGGLGRVSCLAINPAGSILAAGRANRWELYRFPQVKKSIQTHPPVLAISNPTNVDFTQLDSSNYTTTDTKVEIKGIVRSDNPGVRLQMNGISVTPTPMSDKKKGDQSIREKYAWEFAHTITLKIGSPTRIEMLAADSVGVKVKKVLTLVRNSLPVTADPPIIVLTSPSGINFSGRSNEPFISESQHVTIKGYVQSSISISSLNIENRSVLLSLQPEERGSSGSSIKKYAFEYALDLTSRDSVAVSLSATDSLLQKTNHTLKLQVKRRPPAKPIQAVHITKENVEARDLDNRVVGVLVMGQLYEVIFAGTLLQIKFEGKEAFIPPDVGEIVWSNPEELKISTIEE